MNSEEKIRYHCQLVVEYKDVDAMYSQKNAELVQTYFSALLHSKSSFVDFSLYQEVVSTILENSTIPLELSKQQLVLVQPPQSKKDFIKYFQLLLQSIPRSSSLMYSVFYWFKQSPYLYFDEECRQLFVSLFEQSLAGQQKEQSLESSLILLKYFNNDSTSTEELHLFVIAILAAMGANEFVRSYHQKTVESQTQDSEKFRNYNILLSYFNDKNTDAIEKLWNVLSIEDYPTDLKKGMLRLYALHLARMKKNNEAKELLEQLANEYLNEQNTKQYLKIHNDIVSIIPNDNVEKFANYLTSIEQLFEQSQTTEYLLILYAKKHEYAKLLNKYEAIALAKSFLLASSIEAYEFLEEVSLQLSELAKKRNNIEQAIEFLTISSEAKTNVFASRLASEQQKNSAEKLVIEYFGAI